MIRSKGLFINYVDKFSIEMAIIQNNFSDSEVYIRWYVVDIMMTSKSRGKIHDRCLPVKTNYSPLIFMLLRMSN